MSSSDGTTYRNYIGGRWVPSSNGETFPSINPANTEEVLGHFPRSPREDATAAVDAASEASPAWKAMVAPDRARIFAKAIEIAKGRADELGEVMCREEGKIYKEARGEIIKGLNLVEYYVGEGWRIQGYTRPSEMSQTFTYTTRRPLGVVSLITPWNFPWAIPCWKIAPALIAGNTAVFKPATPTPLCAIKWVEVLEEAGLPPGVLNLVMGPGSTVGDEFVNNPAIQAISFTGSNGVGMRLNEQAARRGAKVTCEMGGKNAVVVMADADLDLALEGILQGAFGSTGQRCTATSRVVADKAIVGELTERIVERARAIKVGNGMDPTVDMGPAVNESELKTDLDYIDIANAEGARLCAGGHRLTDGDLSKGYFVAPTVFDNVQPSMRIAKEEVFGPVLSILAADGYDDAIAKANDVEYGLTASIYSRDSTHCMRFVDDAEVGMVHINQPTIGGEAQLPFGGIKSTGVGDREMSVEGINFFTEIKTVFFDYTGAARKTNIY